MLIKVSNISLKSFQNTFFFIICRNDDGEGRHRASARVLMNGFPERKKGREMKQNNKNNKCSDKEIKHKENVLES